MPHQNTDSGVSPGRIGPSVRAVDLWTAGNPSRGRVHQLLSDDEWARLAVIASIVRFRKGQQIYCAGDPADAIYNIISGVAASYSVGPNETKQINAFLFSDDLFGLSVEGIYANSAKAIAPVTAYRIPIAKLRQQFHRDTQLEYHVICKLCHELRQAQRHAFLLARRDALTKIAKFLSMMEEIQASRSEPTNEIHLPMGRTEIGEYVGMSLAAVSRGFRTLAVNGLVEARNRRHVKVKDRAAFDELVKA